MPAVPKTSVDNATDVLCLWLGPWGTDHWMRPAKSSQSSPKANLKSLPSTWSSTIKGISVWVNHANSAEVFDKNGNEVPCGHQRPIEAIREFLAGAEKLLEHVNAEGRSSMHQEMARTHCERLRQEIGEGEAAKEGRRHMTAGVGNVLNGDDSAS